MEYSMSPEGEKFALPAEDEYTREYERLSRVIEEQRAKKREIVVVMGLGFVGAVMAAVVADSVDRQSGEPRKFVIGVQRPSTRSYWKIPLFNKGTSPVKAEDPAVGELIERCVREKGTLIATYSYDALRFADVLVLDVQCDFVKEELGNLHSGYVEMGAIEESFKIIGELIEPSCMVLIETTVPPGTTEYIAYPTIKKAFKKRGIEEEPLLAHSFERVMPGREYVKSIRNFWRVCSGINKESERRVVSFLNDVIDVEHYPLTVLERPIESETCKIVENSYRATILAFLDEWSHFAETNGVDLVKVLDAIRQRPTHSNIIFPGPGIGGYCLPKDGGLGLWAYRHLLGFETNIFTITPQAININDKRALHAAQLVRDALRNMGKIVAASGIAILGASYREDVGDTRYSGSELIVRKLTEMGAEIKVHDPYVIAEALKGADAVVLAVRHHEYLSIDPDDIVAMAGDPLAVVDCFGILDDRKIERLFELGCEVKGLGRGHVQRIKEKVRKT